MRHTKKATRKTFAHKVSVVKYKGKLYVKDKVKDKLYKAKPLGKRKSASGKIYYEYRLNRADVNRTKRL